MKRATLAVLFPVVALFSSPTFAQEQAAFPIVQGTYWPTHGWRSSSPEDQGMDSEKLAQALDYVRLHEIPIHSLLIVDKEHHLHAHRNRYR